MMVYTSTMSTTQSKLRKAFSERKFYASCGDHVLRGPKLRGNTVATMRKTYPIAGAVAGSQHGSGREGRVTLTRVALTGIFALGLKKDRNKVYVAVELADGQQLLIEDTAKNERKA